MTTICLLIHIMFFPPTGGKPFEIESYNVESTVEGYWPDVSLAEFYNPCKEQAEKVLFSLQMGDKNYSALLPGSTETIQYELECKTYL